MLGARIPASATTYWLCRVYNGKVGIYWYTSYMLELECHNPTPERLLARDVVDIQQRSVQPSNNCKTICERFN